MFYFQLDIPHSHRAYLFYCRYVTKFHCLVDFDTRRKCRWHLRICDIKEPEPPMPAGNPGMGGMGGMY